MADERGGLSHLGSPPTCVRVGVTGHRKPPKLPTEAITAVRESVERVLAAVAESARQHADALAVTSDKRDGRHSGIGVHKVGPNAVISSLAEGADRVVAEVGLAAGYSLEIVLPFERAEYAEDFTTADSRAKFDQLLSRATSVLTLDGTADERPRAYEAAGLVMLANIDLLIAIWDGNVADGIGGTAQIVSRAIADSIPVVWIKPESPAALRLSWSGPEERTFAVTNARPEEAFRTAHSGRLAQTITQALFPTSRDGEHGR
jgi:hypothetical protein